MWCSEGDEAYTDEKRRKHNNMKTRCASECYAINAGHNERDNRVIISIPRTGKVRFMSRNRLYQVMKRTLSGHKRCFIL